MSRTLRLSKDGHFPRANIKAGVESLGGPGQSSYEAFRVADFGFRRSSRLQSLTKTAGDRKAFLPMRHRLRGGIKTLPCALIIFFAVTGVGQQTPKRGRIGVPQKRAAVAKAVPAPAPVEIPQPPPPPLTPEQMPPNAPQVSWDGEKLTISSDNSTLADILAAVRRLTGAEIDVPQGASSERVAARLGPGPAREVLASLLSGTDFNYVIQAADENPLGVQSIFLTPRSKVGAAAGSRSAMLVATQRPESTHPLESSNLRGSEKPEPSTDEASIPDKTSPELAANAEAHTASAALPSTAPDSKAASGEPQSSTSDALPVQADLAQPPTSSEPDPNRPKMLNEKIQDMQSLFEQRRQMIEQARKPQSPN
jgi:hypothetical protein